jgi:hypothetical protein
MAVQTIIYLITVLIIAVTGFYLSYIEILKESAPESIKGGLRESGRKEKAKAKSSKT